MYILVFYMSSTLIIEGKEYTPATHAGKYFEYTKDYLLMLIKQGKIEGKKVGHRWYVFMPSAQQFFNDAKRERAVRRETMSTLRKVELKEHTHARTKNYHHTAVVETCAIVVIGLALGVTGYFTTVEKSTNFSSTNGYGVLEELALSLYTLVGGEETQRAQVVETNIESSIPSQKGIVVFPESKDSNETIASIQESFSDPVTVTQDSENPGTGIVIPHFKDRDGAPYRFLLVPVVLEENS